MFKVVYNNRIGAHTVRDVKKANVYLHSGGAIFDTPEYWPTVKLAQAVLNKYQPPKPKHEWVHGDVFVSSKDIADNQVIMMYLHPELEYGMRRPQVVYINSDTYPYGMLETYIKDATFLFNIKDKL